MYRRLVLKLLFSKCWPVWPKPHGKRWTGLAQLQGALRRAGDAMYLPMVDHRVPLQKMYWLEEWF